jgi:Asp-tRNA(Asn)/Glu-tRNA(Gln) amidotransferase A subunit family amidase
MIEAHEAKARELVSEARQYMRQRNEDEAVQALNQAGVAALMALGARIESAALSELSEDDRSAWAWLSYAHTEYEHQNIQLGDWYHEGARRRALERYLIVPSR